MSTLKLTPNYMNSYEAAHKILSNNPWFQESDWLSMARSGDLDQYITVLANTDKITDKNKFYSDYNYKYADGKTRVAALYNEILADRTNTDTVRQRIMTDESGNVILDAAGKPQYEKYTASDYDYYKSIIKSRNDEKYQEFLRQQEQERKDSMNGFVKFFADVAALGTSVAYGFVNQVDSLTNSLAAIGEGVSAVFKNENPLDAIVETNASDTWRFFEQMGVQDWIIDFESRYTDFRDLDGNYTDVGKYIGGICNTIGQLIPSMLGGKAAGAISKGLGASAKTVSTVSQVTSTLIFYQAMTSSNVRDMYKQMAAEGVSVSSGAILANASIKSALQWAVEVGLSKVLGGTSMDNVVFGRAVSSTAGKSLASAAGKRLLRDFVTEGLEEVFQETSDWLVDRAFMVLVDENFGDITSLTYQSLMDSFIIGGLASFAGSALNIGTTKKVSTGKLKLDKDGQVQLTKKGEPKVEKLSKLASWEYGLDMQSFMRNYVNIQEQGKQVLTKYGKDSKEAKQWAAAFTEMYASYRMIASIYNEIGEERFKNANEILTKITSLINEGKFNNKSAATMAHILMDKLTDMQANSVQRAVTELEKAGITQLADVIERGADLTQYDIDPNTRKSIQELFDGDKNVRRVVLTRDGANIAVVDDTLFIPMNYAKNADGSTMYETIAEQTLVKAISEGKFKGAVLDTVLNTFRQVTGRKDATMEEAIYNLVFNQSFFNIMLSTANKDMYALLTSLVNIESSVVSNKLRDKIYKKKIATVIENMTTSLYNYCINQLYSDYRLDVFTKAQIQKIAATRWCRNLYARVINNATYKKLTDADWEVLNNRVNSLPVKQSDKDNILTGLKSENKDTRTSAMNRIATMYRGIFTTNYDGKTYMPDTTVSNRTFNAWLQSLGLTIETLVSTDVDENLKQTVAELYGEFNEENLIKFRQTQFMQSCNNSFVFRFNKQGKLGVYEYETNKQVGFAEYKAETEAVLEGKDFEQRAILERSSKRNYLVKEIINDSIDVATASYLSIDDVIVDPTLLSDDIQAKIQMEYGSVNSTSAFLYLRKYFINKFKTTTLIVLSDGTYAFANVRPMKSLLKTESFEITEKTKISDIIKDIYLQGRLKDVKVKLTDRRIVAEYNMEENTIYINKVYASRKDNYLTFAILHEFQHAIQVENGMNLGMNANWINSNSISKTTKKEIIADVRKHRPELFKDITKGSDEETQIVNDFVYYSSGESTAYGIDASKLVNFYPTVSSVDIIGKTIIKFPWGSSYSLGELIPISFKLYNFSNEIVNVMDESDFEKFSKPLPFTAKNAMAIAKLASEREDWTESMPPKIFDYIAQPIGEYEISKKVKKLAKEEISSIKSESLKMLYKQLQMSCTYEEFLNTGIPVFRMQVNNEIYDDEFLSFSCSNIHALYDTILGYMEDNGNMVTSKYTLVYGFVKPKDMYGYVGTRLHEVWIPTDVSKKLNKVIISTLSDNGAALISDYNNKFEEKYEDYKAHDESGKLFETVLFKLRHNKIFDLNSSNSKIINTFIPKSTVEQIHNLNEVISKHSLKIMLPKYRSYNSFMELSMLRKFEITSLLKDIKSYKQTCNNIFTEIANHNDIDINNLTCAIIPSNVRGYSRGIVVNNPGDYFKFCYDVCNNAVNVSGEVDIKIINCSLSDIDFVLPGVTSEVLISNKSSNKHMNYRIYTKVGKAKLTPKLVPNPLKQMILSDIKNGVKISKDIDVNNMPDFINSFEEDHSDVKVRDIIVYDSKGNIVASDTESDLGQFDYKNMSAKAPGKSFGETTEQKTKRYVTQREAKGTNLEKFGYTAKYKRTQMDTKLKNFIINASENIDTELWDIVKSGKITTADVMDYLRNADKIDDKTFKLINDSFFKNSKIKTFAELQKKIFDSPRYYAMRAVLKSSGFGEALLTNANPNLFEGVLEIINKDDKLKKLFDEIESRYYTYKKQSLEISEKYLRKLWMEYFDGTVAAGGYISSIAKIAAIADWKITGESSTLVSSSLSDKVGEDMQLEDVIEDTSVTDAFNYILNNGDRTDKIDDIMKAITPKLIKKLKEMGPSKSARYLQQKREQLENMSDRDFIKYYKKYVEGQSEEEINKMFLKTIIVETGGIDVSKLNDQQLDQLEITANTISKKVTRPNTAIVNNIKSITRTIKANLSKKDKTRFLKDNGDIFDENLNVKKDLYQNVKDSGVIRLKDADELLKLENRIRQLSKSVRANDYSSEQSLRFRKKMDKELTKLRLENEKLAAKLGTTKIEAVTYEIADEVITIDTKKEVPLALKRILESEFNNTAKSTTQYLAPEDKLHIQMNLKKFIADNVDYLLTLTQTDVDQIIDFYLTSEIIPSTNKARQYTATQIYLMAYILTNSKSGRFLLTDSQREEITNRFENMVSISMAVGAAWKSVLPMFKPEETLIQSAARKNGIEFPAEDVTALVEATASGDITRIQAAKKKMYESGLKVYKGRKQSFFDGLLKYERMAMLSGPGTWIRNTASNLLVTAGNKAAEYASGPIVSLLEKLFPKKFKHKEGQYKLVGTKVTSEVQTFIKNQIIDSGLLDLIKDGLSKYDTRKHKAKVSTGEESLADLIEDSIRSKIMNDTYSSSKIVNKTYEFLFKMLSDDKAVNRAAIKYLGKILVEDNVNLNEGLSTDVINHIADAYVMAAQDYMHKSNFFNDIEYKLRERWGDKAFFIYKQFFPFAAASWNWFMESLNYTPIGLAKAIIQYAKLETTIEQMEDKKQRGERVVSSRFAEYLAKRKIGKGVIGTIGFAIGAALAAFGVAGMDEEDGKYKIHIGDVYIDISDLFGSQGIILGIAVISSAKDGDIWSLIGNSLDTMFLDSTFTDLFNSFRYSETFGEWLRDQPFDILSMFIPNLLKTLTSITYGHKVQYSKGILGKFEQIVVQLIPGIAYAFPKQYDPYTGEKQIQYKAWFLTKLVNKLSPLDIAVYNISEQEKVAMSLGVKRGSLKGSYEIDGEKIQLSSSDISDVNKFYGQLNEKELKEFISGSKKYKVLDDKKNKYVELTYSKMTSEQKKTVIERIMSNNSSKAKIYILTKNGSYKYYASYEEYKELKKLGINVLKETDKKKGFVKN